MDSYFKRTARGRQRAGQILPEPFFVHSDLTTGVQLADLIAYIVSWGMRFGPMTKPARMQLAGYAAQVRQLRYRAVREVEGNPQFAIWSFAFITNLRSQVERDVGSLSRRLPVWELSAMTPSYRALAASDCPHLHSVLLQRNVKLGWAFGYRA